MGVGAWSLSSSSSSLNNVKETLRGPRRVLERKELDEPKSSRFLEDDDESAAMDLYPRIFMVVLDFLVVELLRLRREEDWEEDESDEEEDDVSDDDEEDVESTEESSSSSSESSIMPSPELMSSWYSSSSS